MAAYPTGGLEAEAVLVARPDPSNPLPIQLLYSDKERPGLQWPCPSQDHEGTPVLYADGFPNGKAKLMAPDFKSAMPPVREGYPFLFVPGRVLLQSQREIEVVKGRSNHIERDELVELSPEDAGNLGHRRRGPRRGQDPLPHLPGEGRYQRGGPEGRGLIPRVSSGNWR